jgi:putative transposase
MKHFRKNNRLENYSYSFSGYYFLTICTHNKINLFGDVINGQMILNEYGLIALKFLKEINSVFNYVELDEYVIMPNHEHIILINNKDIDEELRCNMIISKAIQQYKRACTVEIRKSLGADFVVWQHSFYDRIIRNERELENIRNYIALNPLKWDLEKNHPENLLM